MVSLKSKEGRWIMVAAIMASAMAFIDATALNVVLPALQKSLNASGTDLFWILNAYLLMLASLMLIGGSLGDKLGRKKIFMLGIVIFVIGSGCCGLVSNVFFLIVFRVIQGIGGSLMIPGSLSLITSSINEKERGKAIGTWSAATTGVTIGGPVLGGALADAGLWRYIFFINIPIGIIALLVLWNKVAESRDDSASETVDVVGAITIALGLAGLTFGFLRVPEKGFYNWEVLLSLLGGLTMLVLFILTEKKSKHPMMPLNLFSIKAFTGANLLTFFLYAGLGTGMLFLSLNLVQIQRYSQLQSGLTFLPFTLVMILFARFSGKLADKWGPRLFLIGGPFVAGVGLLLLAMVKQTNGIEDYWTTFFPGILFFSFGMSFTVAPLTATVMGVVENHYSGTASGINNAISRICSVFANAVFGLVAVVYFSTALQNRLENSSFTAQEKVRIIAQSVYLGNARPPDGISKRDYLLLTDYFHQSFIDSYFKIMLIAAGLCFVGSLMSVFFIKNNAIGLAPSK